MLVVNVKNGHSASSVRDIDFCLPCYPFRRTGESKSAKQRDSHDTKGRERHQLFGSECHHLTNSAPNADTIAE